MNTTERNHPIEQDAKVRAHNFDEVSLGFDDELARMEADRCIGCKNAQCMKGCPVGINIPAFIGAIKEGDIKKAGEIIAQDSNLPAICGRVCPQESQCEKYCIRKAKLGGSVAIGLLERYVADYNRKNGGVEIKDLPPQIYKAAVVGSGPAGLACAADLAKNGFKVTIYEAFHKAGGVLVYGIPEFRLPKDLVQSEIDNLKKLGVEIKLNVIIGKTITLEELKEENDAVFIGTGAGLPTFMNIPGESLSGVYSANEYLTRVNLMKAYQEGAITPIQRAKKSVVVGAGNVAMDAARTTLRMGAEEVSIVYRRGREEMPARAEEIVHAEQEGIKLELLTNPIEILGTTKVEGIKCVRMALTEPDESGRRRPVVVEGSEFVIECDQVIMSIGTSPNPLLKKSCDALETKGKGTIVVNEETLETSIEGVYAGGDAVTGAATVILAMGAGKQAARAIIESMNK